MHCHKWKNKNKTPQKSLNLCEIVYFSWSSMLLIFFFLKINLSDLKSETCQTCNTSQGKCQRIINNTWFQGKAISPEENRPGSKDSNWQKLIKFYEDSILWSNNSLQLGVICYKKRLRNWLQCKRPFSSWQTRAN